MIIDGALDFVFVDLMFSLVHYCVYFFLYSLKQSIVTQLLFGFLFFTLNCFKL